MFLSIDNPIITDESSFLDRFSLGGQTLLLGMVVVFAMLFVIYLCIVAMQAVFTRKSLKTAKDTASEKSAQAAMQATESVPDTQTSDEELVAAITAAIAAYTGDAPSSFRVVSFKKR